MSYLNCRHGDPCETCNGYVGPLDTYACLCRCHDERPVSGPTPQARLDDGACRGCGTENGVHPAGCWAVEQLVKR